MLVMVDVSETIKFYQARSVESGTRSVEPKQYSFTANQIYFVLLYRCYWIECEYIGGRAGKNI